MRVAMAARRPRRGPRIFGGSRFAARREGAGARRRGPRPPRRYCCCSSTPRMSTMMAAASRGCGGVASKGGGRVGAWRAWRQQAMEDEDGRHRWALAA